jgi:hypothetical protein
MRAQRDIYTLSSLGIPTPCTQVLPVGGDLPTRSGYDH